MSLFSSYSFIHPVLNTGISFSLPVPSVIIFSTLLVVVVYMARLYKQKTISDRAFLLFLTGALGNGIDRLFFGGVRDFLVFDGFFFLPGFIFNVADVFLNIALVVIFIQYGIMREKPHNPYKE